MRAIVELLIRCVHLVAGMIWFGGVFVSAFLVTATLRRHLPLVESLQHVAAIRGRLRVIIRLAIHILLVTGVMSFFIVGLNTAMTFSQRYVVLLVAKMSFVGLMALFHGLYLSVFGRQLGMAVENLNPVDTEMPSSIARLHQKTQLFAALTLLSGLIVLALTVPLRDA